MSVIQRLAAEAVLGPYFHKLASDHFNGNVQAAVNHCHEHNVHPVQLLKAAAGPPPVPAAGPMPAPTPLGTAAAEGATRAKPGLMQSLKDLFTRKGVGEMWAGGKGGGGVPAGRHMLKNRALMLAALGTAGLGGMGVLGQGTKAMRGSPEPAAPAGMPPAGPAVPPGMVRRGGRGGRTVSASDNFATRVLRRAIVKKASERLREEAAGRVNAYLDKAASAMPPRNQLPVRTVQACLAAGQTLSSSLKVAYAHLPAEARGILAHKIVTAAAKMKMRTAEPKSQTGKSTRISDYDCAG